MEHNMSKEYHYYKVESSPNKPPQAYVFGVERDIVNKTLELTDMFIFTIVDNVEVKHRININEVMYNMFDKVGGTISNQIMNKVIDEINRPLIEEESISHTTNGMLHASEIANRNYKNASDFNNIDEYLQYLACKKS